MKPKRSTSLRNPLFLSLCLHLLTLPLVPFFISSPRTEASPASPMKVRVFPLPPAKPTPPLDGQIVDIENPSSSPQANQSRYLSDRNRTVAQEMQSRSTGEVSRPSRQESLPSKDAGRLNLDLPSTFLKEMEREHKTIAAISPRNYLPEVSFGDETLLNTREFAYSSFYVRIKRQIEMNWSPRHLISEGTARRDQWTTVVQFVLTKHGEIANLRMIQPSGSPALDEEALRAIKAAAPFLNPPTDLIEPDGKIRQLPLMHFIVTSSVLF